MTELPTGTDPSIQSTAVVAAEEPRSALELYMEEMKDSELPVGLESVSASDIALAMIRIDHKTGTFVDSLSGETYPELNCVLLGLLKQRVLWDAELDTQTGPLCKSRDANVGEPRDNFPWTEFNAKNGTVHMVEPQTILCETCPFAQWGSHPKNKTSWCTAQYTFPVIIGDAERVSGLLTFQRSGLSPTQRYITAFVRDSLPFFAYRTKITLEGAKNGAVTYYTPKFSRGEPINDLQKFHEWAEQYTAIKDSIRAADLTSGQDVVITSSDAGQTVDGSAVTSSGETIAEPAF